VVESWFNGKTEIGIGIIGGVVSGNVERIDFDEPGMYDAWLENCKRYGFGDIPAHLVIVATPRPDGYPASYRCIEAVEGNQALAKGNRPGNPNKTLIETKGEGGYTLAPGSHPNCHELHAEYRAIQGDILDPPVITAEERRGLLAMAMALNEAVSESVAPSERQAAADGNRPGDDYNRHGDWRGLLEKHGWQLAGHRGETEDWRRPGKTSGLSATFNHAGSGLFWPFSSNAHPFEIGKSYSPFAIYATLEHAGDFRAAARALGGLGYGDPVPTANLVHHQGPGQEPADESVAGGTATPAIVNAFTGNIFTLDGWCDREENVDWILNPLLRRGELAFLYGAPKSGKTFLAIDILLTVAAGGGWCGGRYWADKPMSAVLAIAEGHHGLKGRLEAAFINRGLTSDIIGDRLRIIPLVPQLYPDTPHPSRSAAMFIDALNEAAVCPDLIVVDTYARAILGADENSNRDASLILDTLQVFQTCLGCAVLVVHHANKGMGELRGASAILGGADIVLKCSREGNYRRLEVEFAKDIPEQKPISFSLYPAPESVYVVWEEEDPLGGGSLDDRITAFLQQEKPNQFTAKEISEALGAEPKNVINRLWTLKKRSLVSNGMRYPDKPKSNANPYQWWHFDVPKSWARE